MVFVFWNCKISGVILWPVEGCSVEIIVEIIPLDSEFQYFTEMLKWIILSLTHQFHITETTQSSIPAACINEIDWGIAIGCTRRENSILGNAMSLTRYTASACTDIFSTLLLTFGSCTCVNPNIAVACFGSSFKSFTQCAAVNTWHLQWLQRHKWTDKHRLQSKLSSTEKKLFQSCNRRCNSIFEF